MELFKQEMELFKQEMELFKQEMKLFKQEMELFFLFSDFQSKNFCYKMLLSLNNNTKTGFENRKWNYPNRKWNYFSYFLTSD